MSFIERIESQGITVYANQGNIVLEGNAKTLSNEQLEHIKGHKADVLNELRNRVVTKLGQLAQELHTPLNDLLDWYREDIADMSRLNDNLLRQMVSDYSTRRGYYRRNIDEAK